MCILTIIIRLTHANVWESMGKPCSCIQFIKSRIFYCKSCKNWYQSRENPYQVLQVTCTGSERAMKLKVRMIKSLHHSTKLYRKKYHSFVAIGIVTLCTRYNKDGNKLVIFSSIAWYYSDDYILQPQRSSL